MQQRAAAVSNMMVDIPESKSNQARAMQPR